MRPWPRHAARSHASLSVDPMAVAQAAQTAVGRQIGKGYACTVHLAGFPQFVIGQAGGDAHGQEGVSQVEPPASDHDGCRGHLPVREALLLRYYPVHVESLSPSARGPTPI